MDRFTCAEYLVDLEDVLTICRNFPAQFVPAVHRGLVHALAVKSQTPIPASINVEDFVLGMEALGESFSLIRQTGGGLALCSSLSAWMMPNDAWRSRSEALSEAFKPADRHAEIATYLARRSDDYFGCRIEANRLAERRRIELHGDDEPMSMGEAVDIVLEGLGLNRFRRIVIIISTAVEEGIRCSDEIDRRVRGVIPDASNAEIEEAAGRLLQHLAQTSVEGSAT